MTEEWVLARGGLKRVADQEEALAKLAADAAARKRRRPPIDLAHQSPSTAPVSVEVDFKAMCHEVNTFGATHLDPKKGKQSFQEHALLSLGFSAPKKARTGTV
jgi:hypothetical protein